MFLKPGDVISISHHSMLVFKSEVLMVEDHESGGEMITVRLCKECAGSMIFEGDTVAISFQSGTDIYTTSCHFAKIDIEKNTFMLVVENEEYVINNRAYERYPVSLYSNITLRSTGEEYIAVVKNISFKGLMICFKKLIETKQSIDVKLYLDNDEVSLSAEVVWRIQNEFVFDYGLRILYMEYSKQSELRKYIENLKTKQEALVRGSV
ncbi:MAG: PilZ domain-containing protein [Bacillota bacterium]|nr:PilZ domain-containing protein [Bacillota bacterium]